MTNKVNQKPLADIIVVWVFLQKVFHSRFASLGNSRSIAALVFYYSYLYPSICSTRGHLA